MLKVEDGQSVSDVPMGEISKGVNIPEAEEKVLYPKLDSKEVTFLGRKIILSPLPASKSKEIRKYCLPTSKKLADIGVMAAQAKSAGKSEADVMLAGLEKASSSDEDLDVLMAESILNATWVLCQYYHIRVVKIKDQDVTIETKEQLDDVCTFDEAKSFIESQLEVQGRNDFLLNPLSFIIDVISGKNEIPNEETTSPSLPFTTVLQKPLESV